MTSVDGTGSHFISFSYIILFLSGENVEEEENNENKLFPFVICQTKLSLAASLGTGNVASQSFSYG